MTEEQKATQEAEEAKVEAQAETKATDDEATEGTEEKSEETDEESKQLEAELKREREAREKAEKALADKAFKQREKKRQEVQEEVESEEEKPLTRRELQAMLAEESEKNRKILLNTKANSVADSLTSNPREKELILAKWENRTFPADMSLEEQIEECYGAFAYKQLKGKNSELLRTIKGKSGVSKDASGTFRDAPQKDQPKMSGVDATVLAQSGYKWSGTNKRYEKKLKSGKTLVKIPGQSPFIEG